MERSQDRHGLADAGIFLKRELPGDHRIPCPRCAAQKHRRGDDALSVTVNPDGSAVWHCWRCDWTGTTRRRGEAPWRPQPSIRATPPPEPPPRLAGLPGPAAALWQSCQPVEPGSVAAAYLAHRVCSLPHPEGDLRWHPTLRHPSGHVGPALVALLTHAVTIEPLSLHRTWLAPDGRGKAAVDTPRLWWPGPIGPGGVIRLWPDEMVTVALCVGEGIESSLSAAHGFGWAWATGDAGRLKSLPVLNGIEVLNIVADRDANGTGQQAAAECAARWAAAGRAVRIWCPDTIGTDMNDFARESAA